MRKKLLFAGILVASGAASSSTLVNEAPVAETAASAVAIEQVRPTAQMMDRAIAEWRQLRRDNNPAFATAARFAIAYPAFPEVGAIRARGERNLTVGNDPRLIVEFFRQETPNSGRGWAHLALAYEQTGRQSEALSAARQAWHSADLPDTEEGLIRQRFWDKLTVADHDARVDALLSAREASDAYAMLPYLSASERPVAEARIGMLSRDNDAEARYNRVANRTASHAGLLLDRARYLRAQGQTSASHSLLAQPHEFTTRPADIDKWYEMLLLSAEEAQSRGAYSTAFNIARQLEDAFVPGDDKTLQPYGVRDKYTDLAWLAGSIARERLNNPAAASTMFELYSGGGRSLQVKSKGLYWAGVEALRANNRARADQMFAQAAQSPELFYSQLALERLGREIPAPADMPTNVSPEMRAEFNSRPIVAALPRLANSRDEQALFVRALADSLDSTEERVLAAELGLRLGRPDLGVWVGRSARNSGTTFYYRPAFPTHPAGAPGGELWSLAHGVTRQESSFDRTAISHANAYGMMQLLPSTAAEQARYSGLGYDRGRLLSDPAYNVRLGSDYFARMMRQWDGNVVLAAASYNAGAGNVRKWVRAYGDPRTAGVDTLAWIERIPFSETRGYVQRVVENAAVYDRLNPYVPAYGRVHVSRHLGKAGRPG